MNSIGLTSTARLGNIQDFFINSGRSHFQCKRNDVPGLLQQQAYQFLDAKFKQRGVIREKDILTFLKEWFPNIITKIFVDNNSKGNMLPLINDKYLVCGYRLDLQFTKGNSIKKNDFKNIGRLLHEINHFARQIIQNRYRLPFKINGLSDVKNDLQFKFYDNVIYNIESNNPPIIFNNKQKLIGLIKDKITDFFKVNVFSDEEKNEILKAWMRGIKDELKSYKHHINAEIKYKYPLDELSVKLKKNEHIVLEEKIKLAKTDTSNTTLLYNSAKYATFEEKVRKLKEFIARVEQIKYKVEIDDDFLFQEKLEILEEMFAQKSGKETLLKALRNKDQQLLDLAS